MSKRRAAAIAAALEKGTAGRNAPIEQKTFTITAKWIRSHANGHAGWSHEQIALLGLYPPKQGWLRFVIGMRITPEIAVAFEKARRKKIQSDETTVEMRNETPVSLLDMKVTFGMHKGLLVRDLPIGYCEWVVEKFSKGIWKDACLAAIAMHRQAQKPKSPTPKKEPRVKSGYKQVQPGPLFDCSDRYDPNVATGLIPWDGMSAPF